MFLAVDVGNTQSTLGLFDGDGEAVHCWRMPTTVIDTSDGLRARLHSYFAMDGFDISGVTDAGVASVVPVLTRAWRVCLTGVLGKKPLVIAPGDDCGITVDMPHPETVGADRIANAVAAVKSYDAPVIVVDFGTATNIDVVDEKGNYRGGSISPGLMLSANALFAKAAKLASIPVEAPEHAMGDTTEAAIQSGLVIGAAAQAEGLVSRMKNELGIQQAKVIGTGGLARTVSKATELFDAVDPSLTLRGIRDIWAARQGE